MFITTSIAIADVGEYETLRSLLPDLEGSKEIVSTRSSDSQASVRPSTSKSYSANLLVEAS